MHGDLIVTLMETGHHGLLWHWCDVWIHFLLT